MPEITVIIPTHNRWHLLRRTLAGALGQESVDHEVIVVDDGSSDETPERLAELDDSRLRVFRHETGRGVAVARNRGLKEARGDWVGFLDDDDLWAPWKLRCQLDAAHEADSVFSFASAVLVDEKLSVVDVQRAPDPTDILDNVLRWQAIPGGCSNIITRTDLAQEVGGFDPSLSMVADWDMWIRLLLRGGGRASRCDEFFVGYYQHASNMSVVDTDVFRDELAYMIRKHAEARAERKVEIDEVLFSRWLAGGYRRSGDRRGAARAYLHTARSHRNLGNVVRAFGLLFGEPTMQRRSRYSPEEIPRPDWLDLYREGGRLEAVFKPHRGET